AVLQVRGLAELTWWGGIAVAALLGGSAALVPAVLAALGYAAIERLEAWMVARERQAARRAVSEQRETAVRLRDALDRMEDRVLTIRAELRALSSEGAGALLLQPADQSSVDRATNILRRLALAVEVDPDSPGEGRLGRGATAFRLLRDTAALLLWLVAATGALSLVLPALVGGSGGDVPGLMAGAVLAALGALMVGGGVLRWILLQPALGSRSGLRAALVLLLGLLAVSLAVALGPLIARSDIL
ncbi:MAG: hypothetical protein GWM90_07075, partial [Gemmatimonadetes bacterium]|nr:hypothetical protein [Gemmatimonadota bacterium]NIQ53579.1 hypothetical protein [Gemmatimonadota bacterium]NIU73736.1 hypothetical protein [Gammaproteobacteria bacterium]NIX43877.1 hypothetical protein [Gemmatimonadota bacterium]NIY08091.1 hypothetical protein [Gemmatimonadota bacterium]